MWINLNYLLVSLLFTLSIVYSYPVLGEGLAGGRTNFSNFYELNEWKIPTATLETKSRSNRTEPKQPSHLRAESDESAKLSTYDSLFQNKKLDANHLMEYITLFNMLSDAGTGYKNVQSTTESSEKLYNDAEIQRHENELLAKLDREEQKTLANIFLSLWNKDSHSNIMKIESKVDSVTTDRENWDHKGKSCSKHKKVKAYKPWLTKNASEIKSTMNHMPILKFPFYESYKLPPTQSLRTTEDAVATGYSKPYRNQHKNFAFTLDNDPYASDSDLLSRILQIIQNIY